VLRIESARACPTVASFEAYCAPDEFSASQPR
jgi:hypothetical protein